jgi:hypothetical protein
VAMRSSSVGRFPFLTGPFTYFAGLKNYPSFCFPSVLRGLR